MGVTQERRERLLQAGVVIYVLVANYHLIGTILLVIVAVVIVLSLFYH